MTSGLTQPNAFPPKVILWGGTGQAKVNRPIIEHFNSRIVAVFDDTPGLKSPFSDVPIFEGWSGFTKWIKMQRPHEVGFCLAIGNPHGRVRLALHEKLKAEGLRPVSLVHPTAWIDGSVTVGEGAQIMAGAIIQPEVLIGRQCIVNTKASVDHECVLEDGVEITPGATLCGNVTVRTNGWVCAGATVGPRVTIGADSIVAAGSVVLEDVPDGVMVVGAPARIVKTLRRSGSEGNFLHNA